MCFNLIFLFIFVSLSSCTGIPISSSYKDFYSHLDYPRFVSRSFPVEESDNFLIILVDARHLDYTDNFSFLKSIAENPDGTRNGKFGHTWVYLNGRINGKSVVLEGGHSGELGIIQPTYFDGIMDYNDSGHKNPISYLWSVQKDGFFQAGSGGHRPTFAMKINLTEDRFSAILNFIKQYEYDDYSIIDNQCTDFVAKIAELANLQLSYLITMPIQKRIYFRGRKIYFWKNACYDKITFGSPDIFEKSLIEAVCSGKGDCIAVDDFLFLKRKKTSSNIDEDCERSKTNAEAVRR